MVLNFICIPRSLQENGEKVSKSRNLIHIEQDLEHQQWKWKFWQPYVNLCQTHFLHSIVWHYVVLNFINVYYSKVYKLIILYISQFSILNFSTQDNYGQNSFSSYIDQINVYMFVATTINNLELFFDKIGLSLCGFNLSWNPWENSIALNFIFWPSWLSFLVITHILLMVFCPLSSTSLNVL